jgi:proline iminopeptidase
MAPDVDARRSRADPFSPLTSEQLAVGDGHELYVESVGHEGGIGAVYLHGGPGSGSQPDHRRLFDPERSTSAAAAAAPRKARARPTRCGI